MADVAMETPKPAGNSSPKVVKPRSTLPASSSAVLFGCEHIHEFSRDGKVWRILLDQYIKIVNALQEKAAEVIQTYRIPNKQQEARPSIRPTFLCLQCPFVFSAEGMHTHWNGPKRHSFFVESRSGYLHCQNCDDFIYDPQLESIRLQKGSRKRKFDDYSTDVHDDPRLVSANTTPAPCRAVGLRGFYNMGNTCFMSVVIQSLLHNPFLRAFFLSRGHRECKEDDKERCTSCALDEIFTEFHSMEKTEGYGAVGMLIRSWKSAEHLAGYQQQDAHEYMQFILNSLHSGNGGSSDPNCPCIIHATFYGKLQSTVTCDKCKNITTALDPFMDLSLDLRQQAKKRKANSELKTATDADLDGLRLQDCLRRFTSEEKLAAAEYTCSKCQTQRDATKQLRIKNLPPVLCIHLKRFSHTKDKSSKLEMPVSFPLSLDMAPYSAQFKKGSPDNPSSLIYTLSAVIVHKGGIESGHYVSFAREGKEWFLFDDSKVVLVGEGEVLNAEAYLLIYVLEDI